MFNGFLGKMRLYDVKRPVSCDELNGKFTNDKTTPFWDVVEKDRRGLRGCTLLLR